MLVLAAGAAAVCLAAGPCMVESAAGQVEVRPAPPGAYTPADPNMIAVADRGNDRIQVFWPNGTFAFKFGSGGDYGVDQFDDMYRIAVGPDGRIFVVDPWHDHAVRAFHPDGSFAFGMGGRGAALGLFYDPQGVAVDPDGRIVVSDRGDRRSPDRRVQVFSSDAALALVFGYRDSNAGDVAVGPDGRIFLSGGSDGEGFRVFHPNGSLEADYEYSRYVGHSYIAVGPDGRVVLYEYTNGVRVFHPNGSLASEGQPVVPLRHVVNDIAVDSNGRIVVALNNHSVQVFHPNGSLALTFGSYGAVRSEFTSPTDVAVGPNGLIVVAEPGGSLIRVFWPNGSLATEFGSRGYGVGKFITPAIVDVGRDGQIVVGDTGQRRIQVFRPDSNGTYSFGGVAFGSFGSGDGRFVSLYDVAVGPSGRIVAVGDDSAGTARVQVFYPNGSLALVFDPGHYRVESVSVGSDGQIAVGGHDDRLYGFREVPSVIRVFHTHILLNGSLVLSPGPPNGTAPNGTTTFGPPVVLEGLPDDASVAVAPDGRIVVGGGDAVQVFRPDGAAESRNVVDITVAAIAVGPDGRIVAVDTARKLVHIFHPNGSFAFSLIPNLKDGTFDNVVAVAVGPMSIPVLAGPPSASLIAVIAPTPLVGEDGVGAVPAPTPLNFTNAGDVANVTIDVGGLADPGAPPLNGSESSTVTFPAAETVVAASFATVSFPPNVTAAYVPAGGLLAMHVSADVPDDRLVLEAFVPNGSGSVVLRRVVEVGGHNASVVFDRPVRILLEGQAGGQAFYIAGANGTITPIDGACAADDAAEVHAQLGGSGECQMDSAAGGKIIYTYHLTRFGTAEVELDAPAPPAPPATPTPAVPANGTDGGGGPTPAVPANGTDGGGGPTPAVPANGTDGGAGGGGPTPTAPPPPPPPPTPPVVHTCSVSLGSSNLDLRVRPGEYSAPVRQTLLNTGSLSLAQAEVSATTWSPPGPFAAPAPGPAPAVPPPVAGTDRGAVSGVHTAVLIGGLPASVTELSTAGASAAYAPLANGTAVAQGLEGGASAPLWFRMNLSAYGSMQGGTLVQTITYQAQCALP